MLKIVLPEGAAHIWVHTIELYVYIATCLKGKLDLKNNLSSSLCSSVNLRSRTLLNSIYSKPQLITPATHPPPAPRALVAFVLMAPWRARGRSRSVLVYLPMAKNACSPAWGSLCSPSWDAHGNLSVCGRVALWPVHGVWSTSSSSAPVRVRARRCHITTAILSFFLPCPNPQLLIRTQQALLQTWLSSWQLNEKGP